MNVVASIVAVGILVTGPAPPDDEVTPVHNGLEVLVIKDKAADLDVRQPVNDGESGHSGQQVVGVVSRPPCTLNFPEADPNCVPVTECLPDPSSQRGGLLWTTSATVQTMLGECTPRDDAAADPPAPAVTPGRVAAALRRVPLSPARITVQPPGGKTLVNFDTIFYADSEPMRRTVTLLGQRVDLKIWASSYTWVHGDGTTQTTDEPGRPYQRGASMTSYITHQYTDADVTVSPRVDTTYSAQFQVNGRGPWRDVNGTVTIQGSPATLRVVEARPVLTDPN